MTALSALVLPILLSAVAVFLLSSIIHMMSPWHKNDYPRLPNEDQVLDALRPFNLPPGDYMFPRPLTRADLRSPEFISRRERGPVGVMTIMPSGPVNMGKPLAGWFIYLVIVVALAAFVTGSALAPGADDRAVFHFIAITSFIGFAAALWQMSIWYHRSWMTTFKATVDGVIYALVTAVIFGWMWPR